MALQFTKVMIGYFSHYRLLQSLQVTKVTTGYKSHYRLQLSLQVTTVITTGMLDLNQNQNCKRSKKLNFSSEKASVNFKISASTLVATGYFSHYRLLQ